MITLITVKIIAPIIAGLAVINTSYMTTTAPFLIIAIVIIAVILILIPNKYTKHLDKFYHFMAGLFIYVIAAHFLPDWIALLLTVVIGAGKECYDYKKGGRFDWIDLLVTIAPALILFLIQ